MDIVKAIDETFELLKIVLPIMFFGILISNVLFSLPQIRRLSKPLDAFTSIFGVRCGNVILSFMAHPIAGLSLLADLRNRGILKDEELTFVYIISLIPRNVRLLTIFILPIALSTLGVVLGVEYFAIDLFTRTVAVLIFITIFKGRYAVDSIDTDFETDVIEGIKNAIRLFLRTVSIFIPSIFLVMLILTTRLVNLLNVLSEPLVSFLNISPSSLIVIVAGTTSTIAGIGVAGSLLSKGLLDARSVLLSLFIASLFHTIVELFRRSLPINVSLFGRLGVKLSLLNFAIRVLGCVIAIATIMF